MRYIIALLIFCSSSFVEAQSPHEQCQGCLAGINQQCLEEVCAKSDGSPVDPQCMVRCQSDLCSGPCQIDSYRKANGLKALTPRERAERDRKIEAGRKAAEGKLHSASCGDCQKRSSTGCQSSCNKKDPLKGAMCFSDCMKKQCKSECYVEKQ